MVRDDALDPPPLEHDQVVDVVADHREQRLEGQAPGVDREEQGTHDAADTFGAVAADGRHLVAQVPVGHDSARDAAGIHEDQGADVPRGHERGRLPDGDRIRGGHDLPGAQLPDRRREEELVSPDVQGTPETHVREGRVDELRQERFQVVLHESGIRLEQGQDLVPVDLVDGGVLDGDHVGPGLVRAHEGEEAEDIPLGPVVEDDFLLAGAHEDLDAALPDDHEQGARRAVLAKDDRLFGEVRHLHALGARCSAPSSERNWKGGTFLRNATISSIIMSSRPVSLKPSPSPPLRGDTPAPTGD